MSSNDARTVLYDDRTSNITTYWHLYDTLIFCPLKFMLSTSCLLESETQSEEYLC
jgi:hypothetical protein